MSLESSRRERERERDTSDGVETLRACWVKKMVTQFSSHIIHHSNSIFSLTQNKTHLVSILNHIFRLFNQTFCQNCGPHPLTLQKTKRPISSSRLQTHLQQSSKLLFFNSPQHNHNLHQKTHNQKPINTENPNLNPRILRSKTKITKMRCGFLFLGINLCMYENGGVGLKKKERN